MAKPTKKKKEKEADFQKPKLKLGKGKKPPTNSIDTSFKARSIALPQQSIAVDKNDSIPTTKRRLSLDDLLGHLKHHNPGVKRDALQGLRELFEEYPKLLDSNLFNTINSTVRLMSDEDPSVRKALLAFLNWLLPRVPRESISPHAQLLLLYATSAQTNIFAEIRIDAVRFLDLLLEVIPEHVVAGCSSTDATHGSHGRKVLDGYLSLLSSGARFSEDGPSQPSGSTMVMLSPASKSLVLSSLSKFLQHAISETSTETSNPASPHHDPFIPLWFLKSSFSDSQGFDAFSKLLRPTRTVPKSEGTKENFVVWGEENNAGDFVGSFPLASSERSGEALPDLESLASQISQLSRSETAAGKTTDAPAKLVSSLSRTLHPILVSSFLDCAPSVFSPSETTSSAELDLTVSVAEIARSLYGSLLRDGSVTQEQKESAYTELSTLLGHMAVYFPFGENKLIQQDIKIDQAMQSLNIIYCELFSLLSLVNQSKSVDTTIPSTNPQRNKRRGPALPTKQSKKRKLASSLSTESGLAKQGEHVKEYVIRCLRSEAKSAAQLGGTSLTAATYVSLLPTLWWLLNNEVLGNSDEGSLFVGNEVFDAIMKHATRTGSLSSTKRIATEFVATLVLLQDEPSYNGLLRQEKIMTNDAIVRDWLLHLPKTIWELGDKQPVTTEIILLFFLRLFQRKLWREDKEVISGLRSRLSPFFVIQHSSKGQLPGPYSKLPVLSTSSSLRRLALDVIAVLLSIPTAPKKTSRFRRTADGNSQSSSGADGDGNVDAYAAATTTLRESVEKAVEVKPDENEYWRSIFVSCPS